jgi:LytR cell envelope-related transcriptional attenuator
VANAIRDIGALAGLGAFLGLAVLSLLYFSQARDVRRLREWAGRAPERDAQEVEATSDLAAERAEELRKVEEERKAREETDAAEEHRELRRQRREAGLPEETRWERLQGRFRRTPGAAPAGRRFEGRTLAIGAVAVVALLAVVAIVATQSDVFSGSSSDGSSSHSLLKPSQIQVDVLNGTNPPVNGLAGLVSDRIESAGYHTGHVGNSGDSFAQSVIMFKGGFRPEAAKLARQLKIKKVQQMTSAIRADSKTGNPLAVVVGQDKANFSG